MFSTIVFSFCCCVCFVRSCLFVPSICSICLMCARRFFTRSLALNQFFISCDESDAQLYHICMVRKGPESPNKKIDFFPHIFIPFYLLHLKMIKQRVRARQKPKTTTDMQPHTGRRWKKNTAKCSVNEDEQRKSIICICEGREYDRNSSYTLEMDTI